MRGGGLTAAVIEAFVARKGMLAVHNGFVNVIVLTVVILGSKLPPFYSID